MAYKETRKELELPLIVVYQTKGPAFENKVDFEGPPPLRCSDKDTDWSFTLPAVTAAKQQTLLVELL